MKEASTPTKPRQAYIGAFLALAAAVAIVTHRAEKPSVGNHTQRPRTAEEGLINWMTARGGHFGFEVRTSPGQERGAFAIKNYKPGDIVASVPKTACIPLENDNGFPAEHAHDLAIRIKTDPAFFVEHLPFFSTLPAANASLTSELFTDSLEAELQTPRLAEIINRERAVTDAVYFGMYTDENDPTKDYEPIPEALGGHEIMHPFAFRYLTAMISSREFGFMSSDGAHKDFMVPGVDMLNCDASKTNVQQTNDGTRLNIVALKHISAGEELFLPYLPGLDHRNDVSLAGYGFIRKLEKPLLLATDLPTFDPENPYAATPADDSEFYGPNGKYNTADEYQRLGLMLADAPTTEAEDLELLESGNLASWRDRVVVEFRVERKKAIRMAMKAVWEELQKTAGQV